MRVGRSSTVQYSRQKICGNLARIAASNFSWKNVKRKIPGVRDYVKQIKEGSGVAG
jgi:hypothetical protein